MTFNRTGPITCEAGKVLSWHVFNGVIYGYVITPENEVIPVTWDLDGRVRNHHSSFNISSPPFDEPRRSFPGRIHIIEPGETLSGICQREYGNLKSFAVITRINNIADPNRVMTGISIWLP